MKGNNTILKVIGFPVALMAVVLLSVFLAFFPCSALWIAPLRKSLEWAGWDPLITGLGGMVVWGCTFIMTLEPPSSEKYGQISWFSKGLLGILVFNLVFLFGVPVLISMWRAWSKAYDGYFFKEESE